MAVGDDGIDGRVVAVFAETAHVLGKPGILVVGINGYSCLLEGVHH